MRHEIEPGLGAGPGPRSTGVAEKAREGAEQVQEKALQRAEQVREKVDSGKGRAAERVRRVGSAVRSAADGLREQDPRVAGFADRASERIERAAQYLSSADPRQAVRDVESFARRQPAVFFGGAFLLGVAAARLLKSTAQDERLATMPRRDEPAFEGFGDGD